MSEQTNSDVLQALTIANNAIQQIENNDQTEPIQQQTPQPAPISDASKPFMLRFDVSLIGRPGVHLNHHVPGRDPVWAIVGNTHQFIDPETKDRPEQSLAVWSFSANTAYFFDHGYLRQNPSNPALFKFVWSPHEEAYPQKIGKMIFYLIQLLMRI